MPTRWCCTRSSSTSRSALVFSALVAGLRAADLRALGGEGASLEAALAYSNVVFAGNVLVWLMNALGERRSAAPATCWCRRSSICVGVVAAGAAVAAADLRLGAGAGARHRRRRRRGGRSPRALTAAVLAWYIAVRPQRRAAAPGAAALAAVRRHPAGRRGRLDQHAADHAHGGADDRAGRRRRRRRTRSPATAPARGSNTCWSRWCSASARRWSRWSAPISAPASAQRALRVALIGGAIAFALTEAIGLAAAIWPTAWLGLFGNDPRMLAAGGRLSARRRAGLRLLRPRAARSISPRRAPGGWSGRCSPAWCGC